MADSEKQDVEAQEEESDELNVADDDEPSIEDEFRNLFTEAQGEGRRLKNLAMKAEQSGDASAAAVLREVAGGVVQLLQDLIATSGGAFQEIDATLDGIEEESRLLPEDAEKLHGLLLACRKLAVEVLAGSSANADAKDALEKLVALIDDQLSFVVDISDYEPMPAAN